ncbi:BatD family protein [Vibrio sp.]|uniref:BatD family protein n=1 Tax=Vibrio sp. TaxID=678 RepID=UPI003D0EB8B6
MVNIAAFLPRPVLWLLFVLLMTAPLAWSATLTATVSKNEVVKNEVFQLKIVYDEKASADAIDFSSLQKDFLLSKPNFGSSINIINGDRSIRSEWNLTLAGQSLGRFVIPAFEINGARSEPIHIRVSYDAFAPNSKDLIEVDSKLDRSTLYPQESTYLTARLLVKTDPRRLQNPQIVPPEADGLQIQLEGEAKQYQEVQNGIQVTVVEQRFRITADKPGQYSLSSATFKGAVIYGDNRTGTTRILSVDLPAEQFTIDVKTKPADYQGVWLPTKNLVLTQEWRDQNGELVNGAQPLALTIGDALSRTIRLDVTGLLPEQLPELTPSYPPSLRVYSEKPQFDRQDNRSIMTLKQVLIPQQAGESTIPGLTVNWWNSGQDQLEVSKLAPLSLTVSAGSHVSATLPQATMPLPPAANVSEPGVWPYLTALFALLWLATLTLLLRSRRNRVSEDAGQEASDPDSYHRLLAAIDQGDLMILQRCLTVWLQDITLVEDDLKQQLQQQQQQIQQHFSRQQSNWNGQRLLKLVKKAQKMQQDKANSMVSLAKL